MLDNPPASAILTTLAAALKAGIPAGIQQAIAANAVALAVREIGQTANGDGEELARLTALLGQEGSLGELNAALAQAIRSGTLGPGRADVCRHLIRTAVAKLAVDQPGYPALRRWQESAGS